MTQGTIDGAMQLAVQHHQAGRLPEAEAIYRQVLGRQPDHANALQMLGVLACQAGQIDSGVQLIRRAIAINPNDADYYLNLASALLRKGDQDQVVAACGAALRLRPDYAEVHYVLGNALYARGDLEGAIAAYRQAIQIKPNLAEAYNNLGIVLRDGGLLDESISACRAAVQIKPDFADAHSNLGIALFRKGELDEAIAACRQALALKPDSALIYSSLLLILHYDEQSDAQMIRAQSIEWARQHADSLKQFIPSHINDRSPDRRLRIGYVSPDFREHPVGRFVLPLLAAHDPAKFEIFCYADVARPDAITQRIHDCAHHWRSTFNLTDQQLAEQIHQDKIDILIDLAGHTSGNRLLVFARKPAPVQATWLGYPDTTGLSTMDYRLTDSLADPPGFSDTLNSERLIRLPHTAWCFSPPQTDFRLDEIAVTSNTPITFGSFNNFSKITTAMLKLWAEILRSTPGSRLMIKAHTLRCQSAADRVRRIMEAAGVATDRVELLEWRKSREEHLASYRNVHLGLDTFPYHGTTTTLEALWMGVPVITLAGATHVARVGVSILSNVGLQDLIANNPSQYVRLAVDLAKDLPRLNRLRSELRERIRTSPLMDASAFARDMESAYRQMWKTWCS